MPLVPDLPYLIGTIALHVSYHVAMMHISRCQHLTSHTDVMNAVRKEWVEGVIADRTARAIAAIQTIRNNQNAASLLATTSFIGSTTAGGHSTSITNPDTRIQMYVISGCLFTAFFCYTQTVRLLIQMTYILQAASSTVPQCVAWLMRSHRMYKLGNRIFFLSFPLVAWTVSPLLMLATQIAMIILLYTLDASPFQFPQPTDEVKAADSDGDGHGQGDEARLTAVFPV
eukprot:NODE_5322_length_957_cov_124.118705_g5107_i0.p1 GENE.NODE_5322_length_957_cov_124.118705_g5107_i0~~NODE_5322_length_957_cov_124.118705_g5107_i0.p1  ORF type:complete len:228 (+),score=28.40 NODE_5322_length_957_cov_124.118705_g5107_i0:54-737(+)